jgi:hypothetical protein
MSTSKRIVWKVRIYGAEARVGKKNVKEEANGGQ